MRRRSLGALLIILGFVFALKAIALSPSSILVEVTPANPAPNENVTITLNSFSANLDGVLITWVVNNQNASSGIGKKSFSLTAPAAGGSATVIAKVSLPDGEIQKRVVIRPAVTVLLWQANESLVPPFYKGKALPISESEIKVVAMPEIKSGGISVNSKNLTYDWKKDLDNMPSDSGYGKNFFLYSNDYLDNSSTISVVAATPDQNYSSEAQVNIPISEPKISFYKRDSALGILWEKTLEDGHSIPGEEIVVAVPYFIAPKDIRRPDLIFNWSINNRTVTVVGKKNELPVRAEAGTSGISTLRLDIENQFKLFQTVHNELEVQF